MKNHIKFIFVAILAMLITFSSCTRIDAGHEGIKVNLYGSNKGVDNVELCTGMVWFNPVTERVYEYPTFVQTVDYDPFTINAKDGSEFTVDPTLSIKMIDGSSPAIFKKYRKSVEDIINSTLYNYTKDAFRVQLNKFTTDEIVSNRETVEKAIESQLREELTKKRDIKTNFFVRHMLNAFPWINVSDYNNPLSKLKRYSIKGIKKKQK